MMLVHLIPFFAIHAWVALGHPVHETVAEVQWNAKTGSVEVALRLDGLDEQWIFAQLAKASSQAEPADDVSRRPAGQRELGYLRKHFRLGRQPIANDNPSVDQPEPLPKTAYRWVGRKEEGAHVWWFFEIKPADGKMPAWIGNTMLMQRHRDYGHQIRFLGQTRPIARTANRQTPWVRFPQPNQTVAPTATTAPTKRPADHD